MKFKDYIYNKINIGENVDKKIILAILVVALIGVVAATYHGNGENSFYNPLASVADQAGQSVSDLAAVDGDSQNANPSSSANTGANNNGASNNGAGNSSATTGGSSDNSQGSSSSSSNGGSSVSGGTTNGHAKVTPTTQKNQNKVTPTTQKNKTSTTSNTYSISSAQSIARNAAIQSSGESDISATYTGSFKADGQTYYMFKISSTSGNVEGEYEISAKTGKITGGAFKHEVPDEPVDDYVDNDTD